MSFALAAIPGRRDRPRKTFTLKSARTAIRSSPASRSWLTLLVVSSVSRRNTPKRTRRLPPDCGSRIADRRLRIDYEDASRKIISGITGLRDSDLFRNSRVPIRNQAHPSLAAKIRATNAVAERACNQAICFAAAPVAFDFSTPRRWNLKVEPEGGA